MSDGFFSGFKWAVPYAFSEALSSCFFKEGDLLFDTKKVYDDGWEKARNDVGYWLQVRYPPRFIGAITEKESETVDRALFSRNWNSQVRLDLFRRMEMVGPKETTQGRLFTVLWKGDVGILELDSELPPVPIPVKKVTARLAEAGEIARKLFGTDRGFVMARDQANSVFREKFTRVLAKLKKYLVGDPKLLSPEVAGMRDWAIISPTIEIAFFHTNRLSADGLHDIIKEALSRPAKEGKTKIFRISAHGVIF